MKKLRLILVLFFLAGCGNAIADSIPGKYDLFLKRWGEFYFPFEDWKWFKAQSVAESNLDPRAVSWVGAMGLMQLMPATAKELGVKNPWSPEENVQGGIKYDRNIDKGLKGIDNPMRRDLMFGSYNCGPGNIRRAMRISGTTDWNSVSEALIRVTGRHQKETDGYVRRINRIYRGF